MFGPRISSSPVPSGPTASRRTSHTGAGKPTELAWATNSCGRNVDTLAVSVSPNPLPSRACGNALPSRATRSGAIGAPP